MKTVSTIHHVSVALALLGIASGSYGFLVWRIHMMKADVTTTQAALAQATAQSAKVHARANFAKSLTTERAELDARFLTKEDLVTFLAEIEAVGSRTKTTVTIDAVNPRNGFFGASAAPARGVQKVDPLTSDFALALALSIEGSWTGVVRAIRIIETMPYGSAISRLHLEQAPASKNWRALMQISFAARPFTEE